MKKQSIRFLALLLAVLMVLSGCAVTDGEDASKTINETTENGENRVTLWVYTPFPGKEGAAFYDDRLIHQIEKWEFEFEQQHKNVDVVFDVAIAEERLQVEIMAGRGPDVFLMPASETWYSTNCPSNFQLLIEDVNQAMRNGIFADISEYYDADETLGKDALLKEVMDVGVLGDARYVLPLRFNMLTAYVDPERLAAAGLSTDMFEKGIIGIWEAMAQCGDSLTASSAVIKYAENNHLNLLGDLIDYDEQEVLLTKEQLTEFLRAYQELVIAYIGSGQAEHTHMGNYYDAVTNGNGALPIWFNTGRCMFVGDLDTAIANAVVAEAEGVDLQMHPIRATDGSVVADVTFYGAVGAGCDHPELAYEFLRYFLTEQSQWEESPGRIYQRGSVQCVRGNEALIADGWPVRVKGSVAALNHSLKKQILAIRWLGKETVTTADYLLNDPDSFVPILGTKIDEARFPTGQDAAFRNLMDDSYWATNPGWRDLSPEEKAEYARAMDLEAMAADFIDELEWHLGEG